MSDLYDEAYENEDGDEAIVQYFVEEIDFELPHSEEIISPWIEEAVANTGKELYGISYIFCSDEYLHNINMEYLGHDTYTDIITFNNAEEDEEAIESDIFISIERVRENAAELKVPFEQELYRVMIHGVLHLLGFKDKTEAQAKEMRKQEDAQLAKIMAKLSNAHA